MSISSDVIERLPHVGRGLNRGSVRFVLRGEPFGGRPVSRQRRATDVEHTSPALVGEDGGLIAGHARILAARQLGIAEIPVMVAAGWSEAQKRAYVLADNQLAIGIRSCCVSNSAS